MKFSVLMSVYHKERPDFLKLSIESILNQTIKPDEIIVVKDGKLTDKLNNLINEYVNKYNNLFTIVSLKQNLGLGLALNEGLKVARNEIIARMDSDDISVPTRFEEQLRFFEENSNIDIVGGNITEFIDNEENVVAKRVVPTTNNEIKSYMKKRCALNHVTVMFKKSSVLSAGGYLQWYYNEDYYLWIRMLLNNATFANTGTILVNVRVGTEMYKRRGGKEYFNSEKKLQKYMLDNEIINKTTYLKNVYKRFIVQVLLSNKLREFVFRKFAREKI